MIYVACSHLLYAFYVLIYIEIFYFFSFFFVVLVLWFISLLKSSRFKAGLALILSYVPFFSTSFFL